VLIYDKEEKTAENAWFLSSNITKEEKRKSSSSTAH
jgi:hypothetical protein